MVKIVMLTISVLLTLQMLFRHTALCAQPFGEVCCRSFGLQQHHHH
jgi:hypothetical protein